MKTLYLQCLMGAAGDMIMAALFELIDEDAKKDFLQTMNSLGLGIETTVSKTKKCGIVGTRVEINIDGEAEGGREHKDGGHFHHHQTDDMTPVRTTTPSNCAEGANCHPSIEGNSFRILKIKNGDKEHHPINQGDDSTFASDSPSDDKPPSASRTHPLDKPPPTSSAPPLERGLWGLGLRNPQYGRPRTVAPTMQSAMRAREGAAPTMQSAMRAREGAAPTMQSAMRATEDGRPYESAEMLCKIEKTVSAMPISDKVKNDVLSVYHLLAQAEAQVHDCEISQIHFHEIGDADAIADIVGACWLIEKIAPENIVCSAVNVGGGLVKCAHGTLPVPAPATALLLEGIPIFSGDIKAELCTPTGAALIKYFASSFGEMPSMTMQKTGYGMGKKDFESANCLRAFLGAESCSGLKDTVIKLECNVDDMTGEALAFAMETLLNEGALDAWSQNIQMKKGRQGFLISCLCEEERADFFAALILKHTSTFGVRKLVCPRYKLERSISKTETTFGEIRIKEGKGYGVEKSKPEYEDIAQAAREKGLSFNEALEKAKK